MLYPVVYLVPEEKNEIPAPTVYAARLFIAAEAFDSGSRHECPTVRPVDSDRRLTRAPWTQADRHARRSLVVGALKA